MVTLQTGSKIAEGDFLRHGRSAEAIVYPFENETSQVEASLSPSQVAIFLSEHQFLANNNMWEDQR